MTRDYVYDQGFAEERTRLSGMEALWDSGSQVLLDELGISGDWKCLEIGAGGGSLVQWMAGRGASVLAVDIDTRFVEPLASEAIEVRRMDIRTDELPTAEFDLVHARLVLEHLSDRTQILERLAATLRPGGWMVIEDYDWTCFEFFRLSFESLRGALVDAGMLTAEEADATSARFAENLPCLHADHDGGNRPPALSRQRNPLRRRHNAVTAEPSS